MPLTSRIAQIYGYAVCLVAVIVGLIAAANVVQAAFDRASPLLATGYFGGEPTGDLTSFEAYRASQGFQRPGPPGEATASRDTLSTAELRVRYEALRQGRIARVSYNATRQLVQHGLLLALAIALFAWHWRWLRHRADDEHTVRAVA